MRVQGAEANFNMNRLNPGDGGPTATAEMFGANQGRQLSRLGAAGQNFAEAWMRQEQEALKKHDDTKTLLAINDGNVRLADQDKILREQYKGEPMRYVEESAKLRKRIRDDITGKLENKHQRDNFSHAMDAMDGKARIAAIQWRDKQIETNNNAALDAQNELISAEAADNADACLTPDGMAANRGRLAQILDNVGKRYSGAPAEVMAVVRKNAAATYHRKVMGGFSTAETALKYLDEPGVKEAFGAAATRKLKEQYETATVFEDAYQSGLSMTSLELLRKANTDPRYRNNSDAREQFLALSADARKRKALDDKAANADLSMALWDEFGKSGYTVFPKGADRDTMTDMMDFGTKYRSFMEKTGAVAIANEEYLTDLYNKSPEEINEHLADGKNMSVYLMSLAGNAGWKQVIDDKRKGGKSGDADGRNGVYAGFKVGETFEKNFSKLPMNQGWISDTEYDPANPAHRNMKNNVLVEFRKRWNDDEGYYKGVAPEMRAENIYYDILAESKNLNLNKPAFGPEMKEELDREAANPVFESVNPATKKTEITFADDEGEKTFIKDTAYQMLAYGDYDIREGYRVPDTEPAGTFRSVGYEPGDRIAIGVSRRTGKADAIVVFDGQFRPRPGSELGDIARRGEAITPVPELSNAPGKTPLLLEWERGHNATFTWDGRSNEWVAAVPGVNEPNRMRQYTADAEGAMILVGDLAESSRELTEVDELSGQIQEIMENIAFMEGDPRSRQDVLEDIREQRDELLSKYERITGNPYAVEN